jgi:hypothetical protein
VAFDAEMDIEGAGHGVLRTFGVNLSCEGACFTAPKAIRVGSPLSVRFRVGDRNFTLQAEARHATNVVSVITGVDKASTWVVGVQFVALTAEDLARLDSAVDELRELEGDDD